MAGRRRRQDAGIPDHETRERISRHPGFGRLGFRMGNNESGRTTSGRETAYRDAWEDIAGAPQRKRRRVEDQARDVERRCATLNRFAAVREQSPNRDSKALLRTTARENPSELRIQ